MRLAPLLALLGSGLALLAAPALHAQADPNPPEAYYPLHVGDLWEYRPEFPTSPSSSNYPFERRAILGERFVAGTRYAIERTQRFRFDGSTWIQQERRVLVRFDAATASVVIRDGDTERDRFGCRLDLPFPGGACSGAGPYALYQGAAVATVQIGSTAVTTSVRRFDGAVPGPTLAAGIGDVGRGCEGACAGLELEFARIADVERGARIASLPNDPDPTPPADYFPLEVGNEWIYYYASNGPDGSGEVYTRRRVLREQAVGTVPFAVDQTCTLNPRDPAPAWTCGPERFVRYDAGTTTVFAYTTSDGSSPLYCQLGADFGVRPDCGYGERTEVYLDGGSGPVTIGGVAYPVARIKQPGTLANVPPAAFIAGIGPGAPPVGDFQTSRFVFARVRGVEYGVRPVAGESGADPAEALALTAAPNPTSGALRLTLAVPEAQTVTVEAFDALGRRVWQQTVARGAGVQALDVDASAWAPGLYVVRASSGQAMATARVVRR